jgi:predicted ferric reductase
MNYNIINTPTRVRKGITIPPWEYTLFQQMVSDNTPINKTIDVDDLIEAYRIVMDSHNLQSIPVKWIFNHLTASDFVSTTTKSLNIDYAGFNRTLKWISMIRAHYGMANQLISRSRDPPRFRWHRYSVVIFTSILDALAIMLVVVFKIGSPVWIIVARAFAVIILTNIFYILLPFSGISQYIPDIVLANWQLPEHKELHHKICGIKVVVSGLLHMSAHLFHIGYALRACIDGCSSNDILIVKDSGVQTIISYSYFFKQYEYVTGCILIVIICIGYISTALHSKKLIRWTTNRISHQYGAVLFIILVIAHGGVQLLGFNYSYIVVVPILLCYLWQRRHLFVSNPVKISRWTCTPSFITLYIRDNNYLDNLLHAFANVNIHINHCDVSRMEWHPFTLSRGYGRAEAVITLKRVGKWTNELADTLLSRPGRCNYINIGTCVRSKFRFHRFYHTKYFFCAGIGITGFIAAAADIMRTGRNQCDVILAWSISNPGIVAEFSQKLISIQKHVPSIKILIYFSNSANADKTDVTTANRFRFEYLQTLMFGLTGIDIVSKVESPMPMLLRRVDFNKILIRNTNPDTGPIGIFICGPSSYAEHAIHSVRIARASRADVEFRIWSEIV